MTPPLLTPLDEAQLRGLGVPDPWAFGIASRVAFSEVDMLGHVNNAAYLSWFESLRIAYLKAYGLGDYAGPDRPVVVLRRVALDYLAPLFLDDVYVMCARTREVGTSSFTMDYAVFANGRMCVTSEAVVVYVTADLSAKTPIPTASRAILIERDGARSR